MNQRALAALLLLALPLLTVAGCNAQPNKPSPATAMQAPAAGPQRAAAARRVPVPALLSGRPQCRSPARTSVGVHLRKPVCATATSAPPLIGRQPLSTGYAPGAP